MIHYKCGGNLVPIPDPSWLYYRGGPNALMEFARCDRCGLPGVMCDPPSLDTEQVSV